MTKVADDRPKMAMRATARPDLVLSVGACQFTLTPEGPQTGLRTVIIGPNPVRSPNRPIMALIRSPHGTELINPFVAKVADADEMTCVTFGFEARHGGMAELMLHTLRPRVQTGDWSRPPHALPLSDTSLCLEIRPVQRQVDGRRGVGFSYSYVYRSESIPIYRLLDRATWELDGQASGCELWFRCPFTSSITPFRSIRDSHSTHWHVPSARNTEVFQFLPLQTAAHGFTMTARDRCALVTWATRPAHIRTLIEKRSGTEEIAHWHEHCADIGHELLTTPIEVLWFDDIAGPTARANFYEAFRDLVSKSLHEQAGLSEQRVSTYGVMEEWTLPDLQRYRTHGLPRLHDAGCKTVMIPNQFANNMNVYGVSNMCCTTDWVVPEQVGEQKLLELCHTARRLGMRVEMWGNTALSTIAYQAHALPAHRQSIFASPGPDSIWPVLARASDPWLRNATGAIEADHYAPVFACLNLRDPDVMQLWNQRWRDAHERIGIDGIFLDSSFNLTSDKFHFFARGPVAILTQYHAHLQLIRQMQQMGYTYSGEDNGLFGVNRGGPSCTRAAESMHLWANAILGFDSSALRSAGYDPDEVFFRGLACRVMWFLYWHPQTDRLAWKHESEPLSDDDLPTPRQLAWYKAFARVEPLLQRRTILPAQQAVAYDAPDGQRVLFTLLDTTLHLGPGEFTVEDVISGECRPATGLLQLEPRRVYHIKPVSPAREPSCLQS